MSERVAVRSWVARCQWAGRAAFYVGTFFTRERDGVEAARQKAEALAAETLRKILPVDLAPPQSIVLVPGAITLLLEEEAACV